ncbi:helix-turn-helix transcriptional regulator [Desulfovibrio aminophilus]|nr:helix-turn-helix transcriptional regulator [Desulfovibrio aminophilus]MCM0754100.1 helix-turn-helix transcriptional regulator [Desulfovibrio aminophilus]
MQPNQEAANDTDPTRPVLALAREIAPGHVNQPHRHLRAQLLHPLAGVMTITTDAGIWAAPAHLALWVPAGVEHQVRVYSQLSLNILCILPEAAPHMPTECRLAPMSPLLRELMARACSLPRNYDPSGPEGRLMGVILDQLQTLSAPPLYLPVPRDIRLARLCRHIMEDPADQSTLPELAEWVGAADRTLLRLFLKETGMSFRAWRQQARLFVALGKLAAGEPVSSVALDLGYESQSAFIAMFRRALGTTPGRYFSGGKTAPD